MNQTEKRAEIFKVHRKLGMKWIQDALFDMHPLFRIQESVQLKGAELRIQHKKFVLEKDRPVYVVGAGKAAIEMAQGLERVFGAQIADGLVVSAHKPKDNALKYIQVITGKHPIPDESSLVAGLELFDFLTSIPKQGLVFFLISGGASSLMTIPQGQIKLEDLAQVYQLLLASGASISEMNCVRRHLCALKGGKLIPVLKNHSVITLALSDVPFDALHDIGSGPTQADPSTFNDAILTLRNLNLWDKLPRSVQHHLHAGLRGDIPENPKPESDQLLSQHHTFLVSSGKVLAEKIASLARDDGFNTYIEPEYLQTEARMAARHQVSKVIEVLNKKSGLGKPAVLVFSGENPVTVIGNGIGGRNQELALAASLMMEGQHTVSCFAFATDGRDGETDAAGAISTSDTALLARKNGIEPEVYLKENDSWHFFKEVSGLIGAMKTGNNLMDLQFYIVE